MRRNPFFSGAGLPGFTGRGPGGALPAINPATLITTQAGGYFDFVDGAMLAVNGDGTGGTPAIDGTCKWAVDQGPNLIHLRTNQTTNLPIRKATGLQTSGAGYGLFNMAGFGDMASLGTQWDLIVCFEQIDHTTDDRIVAMASAGASPSLLQGTASGKARSFDGTYGTEVTPGAGEHTIHVRTTSAGAYEIGVDGAARSSYSGSGNSFANILLGSDGGGAAAASIRFKRMFARAGNLSASEITQVITAVSA